jgi:PKD repeat protein
MNCFRPGGRSRVLRRSVAIGILVVLTVLGSLSGGWTAPSAHLSESASKIRAPAAEPITARAPSPNIHIIVPHPTWINVTSSSPRDAPPASWGGSSAYDPLLNETVYFGGCLGISCSTASNQTWVFSHGTWTNVTNFWDAPPARDYASMDYDANMQQVLLFGGSNSTGVDLNDTWLFNGEIWTNVTSPDGGYGPGPAARYGAVMAFDPQPEENGSVLFGGYGVGGWYNDTWVWQGGAGWVPLTPSIAPSSTVYGGMAYDAASEDLILFGGYTEASGYSSQTWEFYSGQWWTTQTSSSPPPRDSFQITYVPSLSGVLLLDGWNGAAELNDTWLYSNNDWTNLTPANSPPAMDSYGFSLDGTGTTPIAVAGANDTLAFNTTWAYEYAPGVNFATNVSTAEVGESVNFTVSAGGGTAPYALALNFGDGTTTFLSNAGTTNYADYAFSHPGTYNVTVNLTDAVGATDSYGPVPFTVTAGIAVVAHAAPTPADVGAAVQFSSFLTSPGKSPVTYLWTFGDGAAATTQNASHAYSATGTYNVTVNATDSDFSTATARLQVTVVGGPTVAVAAAPTQPTAGALTSFYGNVTGGTAPYSYSWAFGGGGTSALPVPQHAFASAGTYTVQVWVNDSAGGTTHGSLSVTVTSGTSSSSLSGYPLWFWAAIAGLVIVAVVGTALLLRRGRGSSGAPPGGATGNPSSPVGGPSPPPQNGPPPTPPTN